MATDKKHNEGDMNTYEGRKDEYGGTMTGTGYGRQAKKKKKNTQQGAGEDDEYKKNSESKGFNEGMDQRSGTSTGNDMDER